MNIVLRIGFSLLLASVALLLIGATFEPQPQGMEEPTQLGDEIDQKDWTNQIIVKFKDGASELSVMQQVNRVQKLSNRAGVQVSYRRSLSGEAHVIRLPERLSIDEVEALAEKMAGPEIEYIHPDYMMHPMETPNDPLYSSQWHYQEVITGTNYGVNLPEAWDIITGDASIVMGVIDTGILLDHPDIDENQTGYDFIDDTTVANDGDGRDADPTDPGDWVEAGDPCSPTQASSWHGTHVAGTMGALTDKPDEEGVAGINWVSPTIHLRALGKCGGFTSDIIDAIRWGAGLAVSGVPVNTTPAKVLNLSLGGFGSCPAATQSAINDAVNAGSTVVVAAGNSSSDASSFSPASCDKVIAVAATDQSGDMASYSNFGSVVDISAPGGETTTFLADGVLSTLNFGTTTAGLHTYFPYQGTSMASPHVAGIISLMLSANPDLSQNQIRSILRQTSTPFPSASSCTTSTCGYGIINAGAAVDMAANNPPDELYTYLPVIIVP